MDVAEGEQVLAWSVRTKRRLKWFFATFFAFAFVTIPSAFAASSYDDASWREMSHFIPLVRWVDGAGRIVYRADADVTADVGDKMTGMIVGMTMTFGNFIWKIDELLVHFVAKLSFVNLVGQTIDKAAGKFGNAIIHSPFIAAIVAFVVAQALIRKARGHGDAWRPLSHTLIIVSALAVMVTGAMQTGTPNPGNNYQPTYGFGSPGWIATTSSGVVQRMSITLMEKDWFATPDENFEDGTNLMSCENYLWAMNEVAKDQGWAGTPLDQVSRTWRESALGTWREYQLGKTKIATENSWCHFLEANSGVPFAEQKAVWAKLEEKHKVNIPMAHLDIPSAAMMPGTDAKHMTQAGLVYAVCGYYLDETWDISRLWDGAGNKSYTPEACEAAWTQPVVDVVAIQKMHEDAAMAQAAAAAARDSATQCAQTGGSACVQGLVQAGVALVNGVETVVDLGTANRPGPLDAFNINESDQDIINAFGPLSNATDYANHLYGQQGAANLSPSAGLIYSMSGYCAFFVFGFLSIIILITQITVVISMLMMIFIMVFALIPHFGTTALKLYWAQFFGAILISNMYTILLSMVVLFASVFSSAGTFLGEGLARQTFAALSPVMAMAAVSMLAKRVFKGNNPLSLKGALNNTKAATAQQVGTKANNVVKDATKRFGKDGRKSAKADEPTKATAGDNAKPGEGDLTSRNVKTGAGEDSKMLTATAGAPSTAKASFTSKVAGSLRSRLARGHDGADDVIGQGVTSDAPTPRQQGDSKLVSAASAGAGASPSGVIGANEQSVKVAQAKANRRTVGTGAAIMGAGGLAAASIAATGGIAAVPMAAAAGVAGVRKIRSGLDARATSDKISLLNTIAKNRAARHAGRDNTLGGKARRIAKGAGIVALGPAAWGAYGLHKGIQKARHLADDVGGYDKGALERQKWFDQRDTAHEKQEAISFEAKTGTGGQTAEPSTDGGRGTDGGQLPHQGSAQAQREAEYDKAEELAGELKRSNVARGLTEDGQIPGQMALDLEMSGQGAPSDEPRPEGS